MSKLVVVGSANTDMVIKTKRFPKPGETVLGGEFHMFSGGKGANQAVAAARAGGDVVFLCALGDDVFGRDALAGYEREGIDTHAILTRPGVASGTALITVNGEGENQIVVAPGANQLVTADLIASWGGELESAGIVLTQLETPLDALTALIPLCKGAGVPLILNPAPARELAPELLNGIFCLTPNQSEAESFTGRPVTDESGAPEAARQLKELGVANVVITLGKAGAYYLGSEGSFLVDTPKVNAVDTTAAGDVFNGVLAAGLAAGFSWKTSLERANRAASLSVTRMGAQSSAPFAHEID